MTNIFNKTVLSRNGTLIGNWYEEEVLKGTTGVARNIPNSHIPKRHCNLEEPILAPNVKRNNTKVRILGTELETPFKKESETYGKFEHPEKKYLKTGIKDQMFEDFFKTFMQREESEKKVLEENIENLRMFETTKRNNVIKQQCDYNSLGRRHMYTQDFFPVPPERPDKLFMANHDLSKYPSIIPEKNAENYVDKYIPYYKDKEITYWSMNLEKSNMYRSNQNGINPFAKSSGFTQPLDQVRSAKQFCGNTSMNQTSKNVFMDENDVEFSEKYKAEKEKSTQNPNLSESVKQSILSACRRKGWVGLRKLRKYLKGLNRKSDKNNFISRVDFKYYTINFGINLNNAEIDFIFKNFDHKGKSEIDFNEFLDTLQCNLDHRKELTLRFFLQIKNNKNFVSFKKLEESIKSELHPEVIAFTKTLDEIKIEFKNAWDDLKEDNIITEKSFVYYFKDVSTCVERDEDFLKCLECLGFHF